MLKNYFEKVIHKVKDANVTCKFILIQIQINFKEYEL